MSKTLKCQRDKFLLSRKFTYLNCAYMSPQMKKVENAGNKAIARKRRPHKIEPSDFFTESNTARVLFSDLINNPQHDRVVTIPSVSYGIANAVNNIGIRPGQNIVITAGQFPSNVYPWMAICQSNGATLRTIAAPDSYEQRGKKWNEDILQAIDQNTAAISLGHVHWADGTLFDLLAIRQKCDQVGAALIIDGTQSVGALALDVQLIRPDALVVAGYKWLMGPYSIGMAYYGSRFDNGTPIENNWLNRIDSENFAGLINYKDEYQQGARRYEVGEHSNFVLKPMLIAALKQVLDWDPANIQNYCHELNQKPIAEIRDMGLFVEDQDARGEHILGVKFPHDKIERLQKALKNNRVSVSFRGEFVRVSPHLYNDSKDMDRLILSLKQGLA